MAGERDRATGGEGTKPRRKRPRCVNHPKASAATRCEVCRKPICRECVQYYEGARICGEECWGRKAGEERERIAAEERALRKKREKLANKAVTIGMWVIALAALAGVGAFFYAKASDRSGEKLWESSGSGYSRRYSTHHRLGTAAFAASDGGIMTIDVLTGKEKWNVRLPEGQRASKLRLIDDNRCLVHFENRVLLCSSAQGTPAWELTAPQPVIYAEPVVREGMLYLASSSRHSYYEMSPLQRVLSAAPPEPWNPAKTREEEEREKTISTITSADMTSGAVRWQAELEDIRVGALLADEDRVYAAGYRPERYESFSATREREKRGEGRAEEAEKEESLGKTQLWALNAETGAPDWKLEGTGTFVVSPVMSSEGLVFATRENIYLVSPDGKIQWTHSFGKQRGVHSLQPYEDSLLVSTSDGLLSCFQLQSGKRKWVTEIGIGAGKIAVSFDLVCVPGYVAVNQEPQKVIPTKRWEGSEDLLEKALKSSSTEYEPVVLGIDLESGETRWSIRKIEGDFEFANGILYALRHSTRYLFMDASADPGDISKTFTNLGAYDCMTGEKIWETAIDGHASNLRLAAGVALMTSRPLEFSLSGGGGTIPVRLIAISLQ